MLTPRSLLSSLLEATCLFLLASLVGGTAYAAPLAQGGSYDHQAAARFVGTWQSPSLSVTIEDRSTEFFVAVQAPHDTVTQLCPGRASRCDIWVPGPLFTRDGKLLSSWTRDDGTQVWSEFAILSDGHLLWTSTLSYSEGGTEIIRVEFVRSTTSMAGATGVVPGAVPTISIVLPVTPNPTGPQQQFTLPRLPLPQLVSGISLSKTSVKPGERIEGSFAVRNNGEQDWQPRRLGIGVNGPYYLDFGWHEDLTIRSGNSYTFQGTIPNAPDVPGTYTAYASWQDDANQWHSLGGDVSFTVYRAPSSVESPASSSPSAEKESLLQATKVHICDFCIQDHQSWVEFGPFPSGSNFKLHTTSTSQVAKDLASQSVVEKSIPQNGGGFIVQMGLKTRIILPCAMASIIGHCSLSELHEASTWQVSYQK